MLFRSDEIVIFGINDTSEPVTADLRYGLFTLAGTYPLDRCARVTLEPNAPTTLASFPRSAWKNPKSSLAFAELSEPATALTKRGYSRKLIARHRLVLPLFKELKWSPAKVKVTVRNGRATFESETFVWGVCLDLDGERRLPDNFFDLYPGIPYSIPWRSRAKPRVLYTGNLA